MDWWPGRQFLIAEHLKLLSSRELWTRKPTYIFSSNISFLLYMSSIAGTTQTGSVLSKVMLRHMVLWIKKNVLWTRGRCFFLGCPRAPTWIQFRTAAGLLSAMFINVSINSTLKIYVLQFYKHGKFQTWSMWKPWPPRRCSEVVLSIGGPTKYYVCFDSTFPSINRFWS